MAACSEEFPACRQVTPDPPDYSKPPEPLFPPQDLPPPEEIPVIIYPPADDPKRLFYREIASKISLRGCAKHSLQSGFCVNCYIDACYEVGAPREPKFPPGAL